MVAMQKLVDRKNLERIAFLEQDFWRKTPLEWEFIVVEAGKLTKDKQVRLAARTTVCLFSSSFSFPSYFSHHRHSNRLCLVSMAMD
jgi:hypothetical protein